MPKLLVPFDGSDPAVRALRHAIALARAVPGASIHLVHAHEAADAEGAVAIYVSHDELATRQREHSEGLLAEGRRMLDEAGVPYATEILVGRVGEAIAKRADELQCNSIVMGTRGMGTIGNLLMRSVSTKVVHHAHVPVTLVK